MPGKSNTQIERERIEPRDPDDVEADMADELEEQQKERANEEEEEFREDDEQSLEGRSR
jgi:hypothetical protein